MGWGSTTAVAFPKQHHCLPPRVPYIIYFLYIFLNIFKGEKIVNIFVLFLVIIIILKTIIFIYLFVCVF